MQIRIINMKKKSIKKHQNNIIFTDYNLCFLMFEIFFHYYLHEITACRVPARGNEKIWFQVF